MSPPPRKIRCAIYCRKSSEEGLSQTFSSLDAQRASCLNYVQSQAHEGWLALDDGYDDPGYGIRAARPSGPPCKGCCAMSRPAGSMR
jgi:site-specific DNA recombinase